MLTAFLLSSALAKAPAIPAIAAATELSWVGIDFGAVKIYTGETFDDPNTPVQVGGGGYGYFYTPPDMRTYKTQADAFTDFVGMWNTLYTTDVLDSLTDATKKTIKPTAAKAGPTDLTTSGHFLGPNGTAKETDMTRDSVAALVARWPAGTGLGIGFVADRFSKVDELGCYWPVVYDMGTHAVLWTDRMCGAPSGAGYRNYWLGSAKHVTSDLEDVRKKSW